eukprot:g81953.t1
MLYKWAETCLGGRLLWGSKRIRVLWGLLKAEDSTSRGRFQSGTRVSRYNTRIEDKKKVIGIQVARLKWQAPDGGIQVARLKWRAPDGGGIQVVRPKRRDRDGGSQVARPAGTSQEEGSRSTEGDERALRIGEASIAAASSSGKNGNFKFQEKRIPVEVEWVQFFRSYHSLSETGISG